MRARPIILFAVCALLVAGCADTPTAPTEEVHPLFNAGQGPDKGMTLLWTMDVPESEAAPDYIPCFNDGEGEDVAYWGHYEFWAREVATPSGNTKQHGEYRGYENYRGLVTGDLWLGVGFQVPTLFLNTRHSDGHTILNEPVWSYAQNQRTGEIVRIMWRFFVEYDELGGLERLDAKITNCMPWNGQIH